LPERIRRHRRQRAAEMMRSRRQFLALATAAIASLRGATLSGSRSAIASRVREITTHLNGPVGLQLWSLREYLPRDLAGTLARARQLGFREVEGAGLWGHTVAAMRAALDRAELRCRSAHIGFERLRDDPRGAFAEVKAVGA